MHGDLFISSHALAEFTPACGGPCSGQARKGTAIIAQHGHRGTGMPDALLLRQPLHPA